MRTRSFERSSTWIATRPASATKISLAIAALLLLLPDTRADASIITWEFDASLVRASNIESAGSRDPVRARLTFDSDARFEPASCCPDTVGDYFTTGAFEFGLDSPIPFARTLPMQPLRIGVSNNIQTASRTLPPFFDQVHLYLLNGGPFADVPWFEVSLTLYFTPPANGFTDTIDLPLVPPPVINVCSVRVGCPDYALVQYYLSYKEPGGVELIADITKTSAIDSNPVPDPGSTALLSIGLLAVWLRRRIGVKGEEKLTAFRH